MYNKKELRDIIFAYEKAIEMKAFFLSTLEKFKHHKKIDKRFIDQLKKNESYYAYMIKEGNRITLMIYLNGREFSSLIKDTCSMRIYRYGQSFLTPACLLEEANLYKYDQWLCDYKKKLEVFDDELKQFKTVLKFIESQSESCLNFSFSIIIREMKNKIYHCEQKQ